MTQGQLVSWKSDRLFGFIARTGEPDIFVHYRELQAGGISEPRIGMLLEFLIERQADGRERAVEVRAV